MRPLKRHFPDHALTTFDTLRKQTKEGRVLRRAQAVREVVAGHQINAVSAAFHVANSARRKWVQRFAQEGPQGLRDRPRSGRPPQLTCELEQPRQRLVAQAPLEHGSHHSQWRGRALATVFARETGGPLGRESVRGVLKTTFAPTAPPANCPPPQLISPTALWPSRPSRTRRARARLCGSMQLKLSCGALPCPGWAGGAAPSGIACPHAR